MNKYNIMRVVILLCFLFMLVLSNKIVGTLDTSVGDLSPVEYVNNFDLSQYAKDEVFYSFYTFEMYSNITRHMDVLGFAFVETEYDSSDREVILFLSNETDTYRIKLPLEYNEIKYMFPNRKLNNKKNEYKIIGKFSTINIKNGSYKVYVYVKENNHNYGIIDTGRSVKINNNTDTAKNIYYRLNEPVEFDKPFCEGKIDYYIENIIPSKNRVYISGYGFLESDKRKGNTYIGITDKLGNEMYYETFQISRIFLEDVYGAYTSGFRTLIKIKNMNDYEVTSIIIKGNDGKLYKSKISKENIHSNAGTLTKIDESQIIYNAPILYYFDRFINLDSKKVVGGWGYLLDGNKVGTVYIGVKNKEGKEYIFETEQIRRQDVAKKYNNINLEQAGFRTDIELDNPKDYKFSSIYIKIEDKYYKASPYAEQVAVNNISENSEVKFNIDKFSKKNQSLSITGWSFLSDNSSESSVYIGVKDIQGNEVFYTTRKVKRNDVAKNFGNAGLDLSGFTTIIEYDNVSSYKLSSLVLQDKGVNYKIDISDKEVEVKNTRNNNIKYFFDLYKEAGNRLSVKGWAFTEDSKTGEVILAFKDKNNSEKYYAARSYNRNDVVRAFDKNKDLIKSGFYTDIDFDNINNYTLSGIIIKENDNYYRKNVSIEDVRVKENNVVSIERPITDSNQVVFIARTNVKDEKITVEGWGFLKGQKAQSKIYIAVMDKDGKETIYDTHQYTNKTVEEKYAGENIPLSGFRVNITTSNAEDYEASGIIIEDNGKYYRANIGNIINNLTANKQINLQGEESNKNVKWFIDKLNRDNKSIYISGWALDNDLYQTGDILVGLKDSHGNELYYDTSKVIRYDVCWHVGNDNVSEAGFSARIDTDGDPDGYSLSSIVYTHGKEGYTKVDLTGEYGQETAINEIEQGFIKYQIDTFENKKNRIVVKGYAYFGDDNQTGGKVYIGLTDSNGRERYYSTNKVNGQELAGQLDENIKNESSEEQAIVNGRFSTVLFINNDVNYKITSIIIEKDGKFYKRM